MGTPLPPGADALLYNLVYCSRATAGVGDGDIARILATARRRNPAQGITGVLVYGGGIFFQWLEGPRANARRMMTALHADTKVQAEALQRLLRQLDAGTQGQV